MQFGLLALGFEDGLLEGEHAVAVGRVGIDGAGGVELALPVGDALTQVCGLLLDEGAGRIDRWRRAGAGGGAGRKVGEETLGKRRIGEEVLAGEAGDAAEQGEEQDGQGDAQQAGGVWKTGCERASARCFRRDDLTAARWLCVVCLQETKELRRAAMDGERFQAYVAEFREFSRFHKVGFGHPHDVLTLAHSLENSERFRVSSRRWCGSMFIAKAAD